MFNAPGKRDRKPAGDLRCDAMPYVASTGCQWRCRIPSTGWDGNAVRTHVSSAGRKRNYRQGSIVLTFPILTDRLELTPLTQADRDAFVAYRRMPEVARWQSWTPDYTQADADDLIASQPSSIESKSGRWLQIAVRCAGALVGDVAVHALADQPDSYEVGATIAPTSQGSGYATEALSAVIAGLFGAQGAHRVFALSDARNEPVARLFQRLGFRHEGRNIAADWFKGEWTSVDTWAALRA